jgi:hypothetical protein
MTITLDAIKAEHTKIGAMIAAFEQQTDFPVTIQFPQLKEGERFVGVIISADGTKRHAVILLPGEREGINHADALAWAESIGGDLPDRVEQVLMWATLRDQFKAGWYWSREQLAADSFFAWCQSFYYGGQGSLYTYSKLFARAVRRVVIE